MKYALEYSWLLEDRRIKVRATVLCYNLKGTTKGRKIGLIFGFLGVLRLRDEINVLSSVTGASKNHSTGVVFS